MEQMEAVIENPSTEQAKQRVRRAPGIAQNSTPELPRTYTKDHVHKTMLAVTSRTIQRWRLSLGFPHTKSLGVGRGTDVYLADEVDAWIIKRLNAKKR
jgi:hypothetical protein